MAKHILINVVPWEARVALLEDTTLVELHIERGRQRGIAGNVYKGKVVRVLPGMQAAFVDIGLEKAAFLHVSDMPGEEELPAALTQEGDVEAADVAPVVARDPRPIEERLQKGQEVLVQVAKGARPTRDSSSAPPAKGSPSARSTTTSASSPVSGRGSRRRRRPRPRRR